MTTQIVLATRNKHKLQEFRELFSGHGVEILSCGDFPGCPEVDEDGATFEENALKKARAIALHTGRIAIADDSGLEVDALGGLPGLHSARFAGEPADDRRNNQKLLRELEAVPYDKRGAQFRCVIAIAGPAGREKTVEGVCRGVILHAARGEGGFGYDPLFLDPASGLTFAELSGAAKNGISHRGRAIAELKSALPDFVGP